MSGFLLLTETGGAETWGARARLDTSLPALFLYLEPVLAGFLVCSTSSSKIQGNGAFWANLFEEPTLNPNLVAIPGRA